MRILLLLFTLCLMVPLRADETAQRLNALSQKHAASVVTVAVTISADDQRVELEAEGLVVDASGLIMTTNTAIDPFSMRAEGGEEMVTNVVGAKVILPGGQEVPARLMLRDKTRNVAFLRALQPLKLPALPFAQSRAVAAQGEPITLVGRLGKAGARVPAVESVRLLAVMDKPRKLYVLPLSAARLGEAAFNEKGELLGMVSMRMVPTARASFNETDRYIAVVIPCADAWTIALQTPPLKPAAAKPAAAKPAAAKSAAAKPVVKPATAKPAANALQITDVRVGSGPVANVGDRLSMNYKGTLLNGKVFDQSYGRGAFEFQLGAGQVIEGWDKGIVGMRVGGQRKLVIPAKMAYGEDSPGPEIPPNSTLVFEVELLSVNGKTK